MSLNQVAEIPDFDDEGRQVSSVVLDDRDKGDSKMHKMSAVIWHQKSYLLLL